jgi:hypothetical protein
MWGVRYRISCRCDLRGSILTINHLRWLHCYSDDEFSPACFTAADGGFAAGIVFMSACLELENGCGPLMIPCATVQHPSQVGNYLDTQRR